MSFKLFWMGDFLYFAEVVFWDFSSLDFLTGIIFSAILKNYVKNVFAFY